MKNPWEFHGIPSRKDIVGIPIGFQGNPIRMERIIQKEIALEFQGHPIRAKNPWEFH